MKLLQAMERIQEKATKPFSDIFSQEQLEGIIINKGRSGQILETAIGLSNSSKTLDFEDGELKTNKVDFLCKPLETMFITQVTSIIDDLLDEKDFYDSKVYKKINNLLYVPICKTPKDNPGDWFIHPPIHADLHSKDYAHILTQLEDDYYSICKQLNQHTSGLDGYIHTSNGKYMQIRSKDSKPYNPIFSRKLGRYISNKNHAFYFKKEFMMELQRIGYSRNV